MLPLILVVLLLGPDGDTIIVRPEQGASVKVRLIHIDAPDSLTSRGCTSRQVASGSDDIDLIPPGQTGISRI